MKARNSIPKQTHLWGKQKNHLLETHPLYVLGNATSSLSLGRQQALKNKTIARYVLR